MQKLQGIAVSPGVAIGEALVMDNEGFRIPRRFVARDAVDDELERLDQAIVAAGTEIERNREAVFRELGEQYGAMFSAHLQMLRDPALRTEVESMIRERHYSPEYAVSRALRRYAKVFQTIESSYLAERANDIFDIEKRLLRNLLGRRREELSHLISPVIVLAHNLTPSETANLDRAFVRGFVTEIGGPGSHTAIVAEGLEIPAVVGIGNVSDRRLRRRPGDHRRRSWAGDPAARRRNDRPLPLRGGTEQEPRRAVGHAPRSAGRNGRRHAHRTVGQHRVSARSGTLPGTRGRRHRPVPHRVSVPGSGPGARRAGPLRGLLPRHGRDGRPAGRDSQLRPGGRQSHDRSGSGQEPHAGPAQHSPVAQEPAPVSHAIAGRAAGQRAGRRAAHVSAGHHAVGVAAGQDGAGRRDGGSGRRGHRRSTARCPWA